ncbi:hypothetical protein KIL84_005556 [Mauremys mutica]|uniref:Uncharacterized protein n=1 Tax=Mauremys mutica TaxID=74926 RepID=A0A9D3WN77_9SAUR|nr:hypothetical protein KIL84_001522 [Mauremys mutica]KAH1164806.1 hypothetical protein KIL84_005556 [Mauremys mutica]
MPSGAWGSSATFWPSRATGHGKCKEERSSPPLVLLGVRGWVLAEIFPRYSGPPPLMSVWSQALAQPSVELGPRCEIGVRLPQHLDLRELGLRPQIKSNNGGG